MSIDTLIQLRTPISAEAVKETLMCDRELADIGLSRSEDDLVSMAVSLMVRTWRNDGEDFNDGDLIENGFQTGSVRITVIPGRGSAGHEGQARAIAAVLRLVPGDVCLASQDSAGPDLLRLDSVVYINPDGYRPENLTDYGYRPDRLVVGIPPEVVASLV